MAPTNTKTYRQIDVDRENIDYDSAKHLLRLRTELGYNVIIHTSAIKEMDIIKGDEALADLEEAGAICV